MMLGTPLQLLAPAMMTMVCLMSGLAGRVSHAEDDIGSAIAQALIAIENRHLKAPQIDHRLAEAWCEAYMRNLDPWRLCFLESDRVEFKGSVPNLAESARTKDFVPLREIAGRYRHRVSEVNQFLPQLLINGPDSSPYEKHSLSEDSFASDTIGREDRWRRRIAAELLAEKIHGNPFDETKKTLGLRYQRMTAAAESMTDERMEQIALNALCQTIDPHSAYLSRRYLESLSSTVSFDRYQLGLEMRQLDGEWLIINVHSIWRTFIKPTEMIGWTVIGISLPDGGLIDLSGRDREDLVELLYLPFGPNGAGNETDVVMELRHPETWERKSISWKRLSTRDFKEP